MKLSGSDDWHTGVVIKARKEWVELDSDSYLAPHITGENEIVEWEPIPGTVTQEVIQ